MSVDLIIAGTGYPELASIAEESSTLDGQSVNLLGFLDDNPNNLSRSLCGYEILGGFSFINRLKDVYVVNSIARTTNLRKKTTTILHDFGASFTSIVHHTARCKYASIGLGTFIGPYVVLEANSTIANHCCILSHSVVAHDSYVSDYCFLGHGSKLQGSVFLEEQVFMGAGSVILPGVRIGQEALIGVNSTIISDVNTGYSMSAPISRRVK